MSTVLVCDSNNEVFWQIRQSTIIKFNNKIKKIKKFENEESVLFYLEDKREENYIAFIDVSFNFNRGIILANKMRRIQKNVIVIFLGKLEDYNSVIYDIEHVYFLLKPLDEKLINRAFLKALIKIKEHRNQYIVAETKSELSIIPLNEIVFIEKEKRKVHIIDDKGGKTSYYSCFCDVETQLNNEFYRCHNSYIINLEKVISVEYNSVKTILGKQIPVSRPHIKELKKLLIRLNMNNEVI